jgi:hypothetical protein
MWRWTRLFPRDEDGELAPLLLEWYRPSFEVSEPESGGDKGSYISGDGGGGEAGMARET